MFYNKIVTVIFEETLHNFDITSYQLQPKIPPCEGGKGGDFIKVR